MKKSEIEKEYYYYMTRYHKEMEKNNFIIKFLYYFHKFIVTIITIFIFKNKKRFNLYIICFLIIETHWMLLNNECIICFIVKKLLNKNYKLGHNHLMIDLDYNQSKIKNFNEYIKKYSYYKILFHSIKWISIIIICLIFSNFSNKKKMFIIIYVIYCEMKRIRCLIDFFKLD